MIATTLVLLAALVVAVICVVLVLHRDYEDGFVGRVALAIIGLCALARALKIVSAGAVVGSPIGVLLWFGNPK